MTARCITYGVMKWLSICWAATMITTTRMAVVRSPVVRATMTPGMPPMYGPINGIMLKSPAIMPMISQNGRSMMASPIDTSVPTMNATTS